MPPTRTPQTRTRKRALLSGGATALVLIASLSPADPANADTAENGENTATAHVSSAPAQTIDNIGASGAWWVNDLAAFSPSGQAEAARMLFGRDGLALSAYRYNIGGGGTGVTTRERAPDDFLKAGDGKAGGGYDWSRDPGGRAFLRYAARYGVKDLIGFVNSAPARWKTNGKSCGGYLESADEKRFARYLADVTDHFAKKGMALDYISPFNEPTNSFAECGQEGMLVGVDQRDDIVRALGAELDARRSRVGITSDESSSTEDFVTQVPQWLNTPGTARYVDKLAHHTYNNPSDTARAEVARTAKALGKTSWSTEICCFGKGGTDWAQEYDPTIDNALSMSRIIHKDFTVAHDAAFQWWTALSNKMGADPETGAGAKNDQGWNDGLIYYDPEYAANGNQKLYPTKRYYALGQYSKFVRPGAVLHEVTGAPSDVEVTAFRQRSRWILVVNNHRDGTAGLTLDLGAGQRLSAVSAVRTSATENWAGARKPTVSGGTVSASLPSRSITTYVLDQRGHD
ncbi:glycoside hydrolase [Streptomyces coffeae]|uniref:Beta-glycosidase n=1 Tax=Streptomyces coffeae TaxID=621382 RepID=A0ABS1N9M2_9ACTN|nr:glycoside hydrolase [Streptomyces coffeae]MBL1096652.1 beta-glycosidase [Streptomyces coffeae]